MPINSGKPWALNQDEQLARAVAGKANPDIENIAKNMGRTYQSILCRIDLLTNNGFIKNILNEKQTKEATPMNNTVTTKTFVGNKEASELSAEQLLTAIEQEESFIARLSKLKCTAKIASLIHKHSKNSAALVDLLG